MNHSDQIDFSKNAMSNFLPLKIFNFLSDNAYPKMNNQIKMIKIIIIMMMDMDNLFWPKTNSGIIE